MENGKFILHIYHILHLSVCVHMESVFCAVHIHHHRIGTDHWARVQVQSIQLSCVRTHVSWKHLVSVICTDTERRQTETATELNFFWMIHKNTQKNLILSTIKYILFVVYPLYDTRTEFRAKRLSPFVYFGVQRQPIKTDHLPKVRSLSLLESCMEEIGWQKLKTKW